MPIRHQTVTEPRPLPLPTKGEVNGNAVDRAGESGYSDSKFPSKPTTTREPAPRWQDEVWPEPGRPDRRDECRSAGERPPRWARRPAGSFQRRGTAAATAPALLRGAMLQLPSRKGVPARWVDWYSHGAQPDVPSRLDRCVTSIDRLALTNWGIVRIRPGRQALSDSLLSSALISSPVPRFAPERDRPPTLA